MTLTELEEHIPANLRENLHFISRNTYDTQPEIIYVDIEREKVYRAVLDVYRQVIPIDSITVHLFKSFGWTG